MFATMHTKSLMLLVGLSLLATTFVGCKDNDDTYSRPSIELSEQLQTQGISLTADGASQQLTFTANRKWTASGPAWLDVTPSSGEAGTHTISVKALDNAGLERKGQILIKFGSGSQTIEVLQAGRGEVSTAYAGTPLAEFIKTYDNGQTVTITEDVSFQAVVISDKANGNTTDRNVVVQAEGAGIIVRLKSRTDNTFAPGALITVKAKGATVQRYNGGGLQIDFSKDGETPVATGETRPVTPAVITLAELYDGKYENMLVTVEGLQFVDNATTGKLYINTSADPTRQTSTSYINATDCATQAKAPFESFSIAISQYATFKDADRSNKKGRITGIVSYGSNKKFINLSPRVLADIQLDQERCTETTTTPPNTGGNTNPTTPGTGGNTGGDTPGTTPAPAGAHPIITAYVEGKSFEKYIQIYNPTDAPIDLSAYSLRLEAYNSNNKVSPIQTLGLSGTLEAKAVKVFKNTKANKFTADAIADDKVINFNGNDNIALFHGEAIVDMIGTWGAAWFTAEKKNGLGYDVIFKRKAEVTSPKATFDMLEWSSEGVTDATDYNFLSTRP